jgi:ribulose-phosphate 3-epimerase
MYKNPLPHLHALIALSPQLIILHAEAEGDFHDFAQTVHHHGIEIGIALLQQTEPHSIAPALEYTDHVLIFSGNLGYQGGSTADLKLLEKVKFVKSVKRSIEIGWDGGITDKNIRDLIAGGVEVANVGGYIQHSDDPIRAYEQLQAAAALTGMDDTRSDGVQS